jgi:hypothetical protein
VGYAAPLIGLGFGALLTVAGLAVWGGFRPTPGLDRAIRAIRWGVAGLLLVASLLLWIGGDFPLVASLALMAAIAAPPARQHSWPWHDAIALLPAFILTGTCLFLLVGRVQIVGEPSASTRVAAAVYGGLAARVLSGALRALASSSAMPGRLFDALYLLLTLLAGADALTALWRRGLAWGGNPGQSGLLGAWLAWSAAWLGPRGRPRLRATLIAVAAVLLVVLGLGIG